MARLLIPILISLLSSGDALYAAIPANTIWEVRSTASDLNGAGFSLGVGTPVVSASATLAVDATLNTKVTSSAYNFTAADVNRWLTVTASPILAIVLTGNGSSGCTSATVAIGGAGSGATATVQVGGGVVTGTTITAIGSGYTSMVNAVTFTSASCAVLPTGYATLEFTPGWYQILSTATNAATLDHSPAAISSTVGTYTLYPGVDYTQQTGAQVVIDNSAITTSITTTVITFTGYTPTSSDLGNTVNFASGTNITAGSTFSITAFTSNTWTVDRNIPSSGTTTNAVGKMGGAFASFTQLFSAMVGSNKAFVKATGTYTMAATLTLSLSVTPSPTVPFTKIIGYNSTRGDAGMATVQATSGSVTYMFNTNGSNGLLLANLIFDGNNQINSQCLGLGTASTLLNSICKNFKTKGIILTGGNVMENVEIGPSTSANSFPLYSNGDLSATRLYIHDNTGAQPALSNSANDLRLSYSVIANNGGIGIDIVRAAEIVDSTIYGNASDGIRTESGTYGALVRNNIFCKNGGYGLNSVTAGFAASLNLEGNAYCTGPNTANLLGPRNNVDDQVSNAIDGVNPRINSLDLFLSADPFTNAAGHDWTLNALSPGGAQIRGLGLPGSMPGLSSVGFPDMGAFQHQATGGGQTSSASAQ
ncbi:MAG TPA: right-handed parallel beta-helix repeat-containing protein [Bryobacteraceae bacterium]|jgi:hypothetical protein|nr:right-handed parallel beta-helix repeat-containing protein [Bryobacteraceae bacterium]